MSLKDKINKLINVIKDTDIEEIEVSSFWGAQRIRLSKNSKSNVINQTPISNVKQVNIPTETSSDNVDNEAVENTTSKDASSNKASSIDVDVVDENLSYQKAPLVGTFYFSSKPGEPKFVEVGQKVTKGQTLCIIEAMKIFNEIESDFDGEIVGILVRDSSPVEFNQPIFSIRST